MKILAQTTRATVYQAADRSVAKLYHSSDAVERVLKDERSLRILSKAMENCRGRDGWTYSVVRPLLADCEASTIWLEMAPGQKSIIMRPRDMCEANYRVGVWLASYHNRLFGGSEEGTIFSDITVHNVLIDMRGKTVTGLDPGYEWGRIGNFFEDVVRYVYSLLVVGVLRGRASPRVIKSFLRGYALTRGRRLSLGSYVSALHRELYRQWTAYRTKSKVKQCFFAGVTIFLLLPLFYVYVPWMLAKSNPATAKKVRLRDESSV